MSEDRNFTVNISTLTILKVLGILLLVWFLFFIRDILLLFLVSVIISSAMDPMADYLSKHKIPRALSVFFVYILLVGMVAGIIYLLVPPIVSQFHQISQSDFYTDLNSKLGSFKNSLEQFGLGQTISNTIRGWAGGISGGLLSAGKGIFTGLISALTVLVVSFYLTAEENGMKNFVKQVTPYKHQAYAATLVNKIQKKIGAWVLGQIILSLMIFGLTYLGLSLLGVQFALVLALIAGLLEVVPYLGPIFSAVPAIFFAFIQNPPLAIAVIVLYLVVQQLENHIIVPIVMSRSVGMNPILVILGIAVGTSLGGVVGAVISVPVISAVSIFVNDMWTQNAE